MAFWSKWGWFGGGATKINKGQQNNTLSNPNSGTSTATTEDTVLAIGTAFRCITIINNILGSIPIKVFEKLPDGTTKEVENDIFELLQNKPNHVQTGQEFRETLGLNLMLHGNAYARVYRTPRGKATNLWVIPSQDVTPIVLEGGDVQYEVDQTYLDSVYNTETLNSSEVLHIKLMGNGYLGLSPIQYGSQAFDIASNQDKFTTKSFSQGGSPKGVVEFDGILTPEQRKTFHDNLGAKLDPAVASANSGTLLLEAGFKWKTTQLSQSDMQALSSRKYQVEEVARWFGVPLALLGIGEHAGDRATNVEQAIRGWLMTDLTALLERFENGFNIKLLSAGERKQFVVKFDTSALLKHDLSSLMSFVKEGVINGLISTNEGRVMLNLPIKEGSEYNELRQQMQMVGMTDTQTGDDTSE
ncbi:phage portal protein [Vibrio mytili]|uniref:phage portal protein n=1 Tax=Vibrio mytili TaxID=50718 RepID=UPI002F40A625